MIKVIGGSGFVGTFLIDRLNGYDVSNLDKKPSLNFQKITTIGDITNKTQVQIEKNVDCVVLLAAEHKDNVTPTSLYYDVNVQGTKNVLAAMDKSGVKKLIFTSSVAIYGLNKVNPDENHNHDPFNHYGKSKWLAEEVIRDWYFKNPKNKSVSIIRPTVIFGENNRGNVYNLLKQIASGKFLMIGNGKNKKSMAYVLNVVEFIYNRIKKNELGLKIFNYSDKPDYSMNDLIQVVEDEMDNKIPKIHIPYLIGILGGYFFDLLSLLTRKKFPISSVRVRKFCATTQFDSKKAHKEFNPPYSLRQGLIKTLDTEFKDKKTKL